MSKKKQFIFHGGCHECTRQQTEPLGTEFCMGCCYFSADWALPNLNNEPQSDADKERLRISKL